MDFSEEPTREHEVARLFGDTAKQLKEGQLLMVKMGSIEGRVVAILVDEVELK